MFSRPGARLHLSFLKPNSKSASQRSSAQKQKCISKFMSKNASVSSSIWMNSTNLSYKCLSHWNCWLARNFCSSRQTYLTSRQNLKRFHRGWVYFEHFHLVQMHVRISQYMHLTGYVTQCVASIFYHFFDTSRFKENVSRHFQIFLNSAKRVMNIVWWKLTYIDSGIM